MDFLRNRRQYARSSSSRTGLSITSRSSQPLPPLRDFLKAGAVVGVVRVNRPSASDTFHAEPKISIPTDRAVTDCALYAGQSVEFVKTCPQLAHWLSGFGGNARLADGVSEPFSACYAEWLGCVSRKSNTKQ